MAFELPDELPEADVQGGLQADPTKRSLAFLRAHAASMLHAGCPSPTSSCCDSAGQSACSVPADPSDLVAAAMEPAGKRQEILSSRAGRSGNGGAGATQLATLPAAAAGEHTDDLSSHPTSGIIHRLVDGVQLLMHGHETQAAPQGNPVQLSDEVQSGTCSNVATHHEEPGFDEKADESHRAHAQLLAAQESADGRVAAALVEAAGIAIDDDDADL